MIKQCATAIPKQELSFKVGGKGRAITFRTGDKLWVTNSMLDQKIRGVVMIGRVGKHSASDGYAFTHAQAAELFDFA